MLCKCCGQEVPKNRAYCPKCDAPVNDLQTNAESSSREKVKPFVVGNRLSCPVCRKKDISAKETSCPKCNAKFMQSRWLCPHCRQANLYAVPKCVHCNSGKDAPVQGVKKQVPAGIPMNYYNFLIYFWLIATAIFNIAIAFIIKTSVIDSLFSVTYGLCAIIVEILLCQRKKIGGFIYAIMHIVSGIYIQLSLLFINDWDTLLAPFPKENAVELRIIMHLAAIVATLVLFKICDYIDEYFEKRSHILC